MNKLDDKYYLENFNKKYLQESGVGEDLAFSIIDRWMVDWVILALL